MHLDRLWTRREVEARIAAGDTLVIANNYVLRLNAWQELHPGGRLVIQHMVGRDATDEITISHSPDDLQSIKRFRIGRIEGQWDNFIPPIQGGIFRKHESQQNEEEEASASTTNETCLSVDSEGPVERNVSKKSGLQPSGRSSCVDNPKGSSQAMRGWKLEVTPESYTAFAIKEALDADIAKYPSLDTATQREITLKFRALHQRVHDGGYYDCPYHEYAKEMIRYSVLFAAFILTLKLGWYITSAVFLGVFWQQIMFTAHDAGHRGITHNYTLDTLIGIFIGNFCCGLSIGWWKSSHNVHHFVTNDPVHDPDTQNIPLFTISPAFFSSLRSSYYNGFQFVWDSVASVMVKYQKWMYYPVMAVARYNLYYLSWAHLMSHRAVRRGAAAWVWYAEVASSLFYIWLAYLVLSQMPTFRDGFFFVFVSHLATVPLQIQITLSHWGTSTSDLGPTEAFAQRQLRTTMDIACPEWLDFIHGGLQFQTVHHLFPRVPRHNLRRLQSLVKQFCAETGIEYQSYGFVDGNHHILGKLQQITDQARILAACQAHMAATGDMGMH
ncbi:fatty acid desaturase [Acrodontium crateriforme]|uniref:Delta 8-(E)-sphingolipid desaturase n=1 Tax=Acrodontium crateriforme TaxID=150365 RepID=A0AAQ3M618_9PEZI|nr:fatty acid desaturase [Acrodontium crateriforme]